MAAAAAVGLGVAAGGAMEAVHGAADAAQTSGRNTAATAGQLVLSAAVSDPDAVLKATAAMQQAGASRVEAVRRTGGSLT